MLYQSFIHCRLQNIRHIHEFCLLANYTLATVHSQLCPKIKEYKLEWNLLEKSVKRPFCCTVSILHVYFTYLCYITFWALVYHFIENLKLILKENKIMKQAGFIIDRSSFHIDSMPFTLQTMIFRYNSKSNDVFIHLIHYKDYLTALKNSRLNEQSREHTVLMYSTAYNF